MRRDHHGPFTACTAHLSEDYFGWAGHVAQGRNTGYLNLGFAHEVLPKTALNKGGGQRHGGQRHRDQGVPNVDKALGVGYDFGDHVPGPAVAGQKDVLR